MPEFDLKKLNKDYNYTSEVFSELAESFEDGEYEKGKVYRDRYPEDLADAVETLLFVQNKTELLIRVTKEQDGLGIAFEVIKSE
jgi:hypothetical protein